MLSPPLLSMSNFIFVASNKPCLIDKRMCIHCILNSILQGQKNDCATRECMYVMATSEPTAVVTTTTRMCDVVVCERCDDIGELLKLSFLAGLQGNYVFEGHLT